VRPALPAPGDAAILGASLGESVGKMSRNGRDTAPEINLLRALEVFVSVAETGSMTTAGQSLGMTQSAISQQIKNLEEAFGASLIDRDLRPLRLTTPGVMLLQRAQRLLVDTRDMQSAIRSSFALPLPQLRFGVLNSVSGSLAAPLVLALLEKVSVKSISVWSGLGMDHQRALLSRDLDVVIIADPLYEIGGLERHELFSEGFVLVLPRSVEAEPVTLKHLAKALPFIRHSTRSPIGMKIEQHLRRLRAAPPMFIEFDAIEAILAAVHARKGWAITTPTLLLQGMREGHAIRLEPMPPPGLSRTFALLSREGELGNVPFEMAQMARRIVRDELLPQILGFAPFVQSQFRIARAAEQDGKG
jgi:DNA-binding transcriptional LysR family regulator